MPIKFEKKKRSRQVKLAKRAKTIRQKCQEVYAITKASVNLTITSADPHEKTKICNQWRYHTNTHRNVAQSYGQSYTSVDFNNNADTRRRICQLLILLVEVVQKNVCLPLSVAFPEKTKRDKYTMDPG